MKIGALILSIILFGSLQAAPVKEEAGKVLVHNRVILKIQGKPITVVDVAKKMDVQFYRQCPELLISPQAKYEFYTANFERGLLSLINDYLIVADAEEKEVETTDGDVREEMESLFGPNVVENIDKIGLSYGEAWELVKRDMIVKKMTSMMVRSKAQAEVQPKVVKKVYEAYVQANPPVKEWVYQVLQVRGSEREKVEQVGARAYELLSQEGINQLANLGKEEGVETHLSEEYVRGDKEISLVHKEALQLLNPLAFSKPQVQEKEGAYVARMFFLKEKRDRKPLEFKELEDKLQHDLIQRAMLRHNEGYTAKLRERYGLTEEAITNLLPKGFNPFQLR